MSLSVAPVNNPTFTGLGTPPKTTIKGGTAIVATPGSNGFATLTQPKATPIAVTPATNPLEDQYNQLMAAIKAANPPTPVPRMVTPNLTSIYSQAQTQAENAVNPRYQQLMTDFLAKQAQDLRVQQDAANQGTAAADTTLQQNLQDTALQRSRTSEDTASSIADTAAAQDFAEKSGGLTYDTASRALNEGLGAAGTAESGLGQGQVQDAKTAENLQSNEQLRQSDNKEAAATTLMNRTFEDLGTSDTRSTAANTTAKNDINVNLQTFIAGQGQDLTAEQHNEDIEKAGDILVAKNNDAGQLIDQWLQSLSGQGYTAQEIANAASIYKG